MLFWKALQQRTAIFFQQLHLSHVDGRSPHQHTGQLCPLLAGGLPMGATAMSFSLPRSHLPTDTQAVHTVLSGRLSSNANAISSSSRL